MQNNEGILSQYIAQFSCWSAATLSFLKNMSVSDWGVIIGIGMSLVFGLWGAYHQQRRTRLEEERNELLRKRYPGARHEPKK